MKKTVSLILLIFSAFSVANAQLLWKVSGNNSQKPTFLFATEHVAPVAILDSLPGLTEALETADEVYGELSLADLQSLASSPALMNALTAPADSTLSKVLTPEQIKIVDDYFMKLSGSPTPITPMLDKFKPMMISTTLLQLASMKAIPGFNIKQPLDKALLERAQAAGKPVKGLETPEFQINVLYGTPIARQADDLIKALTSDVDPVALLSQMNEAYHAGDLIALEELTSDVESSGMTEEERQRLINNRNETWVNFLIGAIPTTSMLIVVGAGHFPGPKGILNLLRNAGFTVEPAN